MKKFINILIIILVIISIIMGLQIYETKQFDDVLSNSKAVNIKFTNELISDQNLENIFTIAKNNNVDIFRVEYTHSERGKYNYNVYVDEDNNIIENFKYDKSINFKNSEILSTKQKSNDKHIKMFNTQKEYEFHYYKDILKNEEVTGEYLIYSENTNNVKQFEKDIKKIDSIKVSDIQNESVSSSTTVLNMYLYVIIFILIIYFVINVLSIVRNQKKIAVKKMYSYSNYKIYLHELKFFSLSYLVITMVLELVAVAYLVYNNIFFWEIIKYHILILSIAYLILAALFSISRMYIYKVNVISAIKDLKKDKIMDLFNFIVKSSLQLILLLLLLASIFQLGDMTKLFSTYKLWNGTENYSYTKLYGTVAADENPEKYSSNFSKLYKEMENELGAMLIDTSSVKNLERDPYCKENYFSSECSGIIVNSNYLKQNNKLSSVYKNSANTIYVPKKYKENKEEIIKAYQWYFYMNNNNIRDEYDENYNEEDMEKTEVNIVWIDNFEIFTGDPTINENGIVNDGIVVVNDNLEEEKITDNMSQGEVYFQVEDSSNPYKTLKPYIEKYNLTSEMKTTPTVFSRYSDTLENSKIILINLVIKLILVTFMYLLIIFNEIVLFYEENKKKYSIKKIHGYSMFKTYRLYINNILYTWITSMIIYIFLLKIGIVSKYEVKDIVIMLIILISIEFIISVVFLKLLEKQNIIKVLKEG
ncbi:MAG: DUF1430 domain-containing protein [Mycoplasmatales bacterium]